MSKKIRNNIKKILIKNFASLAYYYRYLGKKIILINLVSVFVGVLDGFGLAMFIPLLDFVSNPEHQVNPEQLGNLGFIIQFLQDNDITVDIFIVLGLISIFFTLKGVFKFLEQYLRVIYNQQMIKKIRLELVENLSAYQYARFSSAGSGQIQNTITAEVGRVAMSFLSYSKMMQNLVLLITYIGLAFFANPVFAFLVVLGGGITNLLFKYFYLRTKNYSGQLVFQNHTFHGLVLQFVGFLKYLKATGTTRKYTSHLKEQINKIENTIRKIGELDSISIGIREPIMVYILVVVILIQTYYLQGNVGSIIASLLFLYRGLSSVVLLQSSYNQFLSFHGSLENIDLLNKELLNFKERSGKQKITKFTNEIRFENIYYKYEDNYVLKDVNFVINPLDIIGFIGESGSGKTTLLNLVTGLLQPYSGEVNIDGYNLKDINLYSYQQRIGYITQEPVIFNDSVFNNVTFWDEKNEENIVRFKDALQKANILNFVNDYPEKEEALLGNNGVNLSGGQRQRIAIARELYKDVDILILDEATSALDDKNESIIQKSLDQIKGFKTLIIVTHRSSILESCNKIYSIRNSKVMPEK